MKPISQQDLIDQKFTYNPQTKTWTLYLSDNKKVFAKEENGLKAWAYGILKHKIEHQNEEKGGVRYTQTLDNLIQALK